ncbi:hypothetical protein L1987_09996 [Smallanthus sonchifolius]|uniref:Uncharacterized protein n=1 Tax=Smallanthus sonchifolius TaxID=185202 RepID=A0ACB9JQV3_9ASTR|nr:hypothetical protein L1987_09996 [Smallanthus sonchifolius]
MDRCFDLDRRRLDLKLTQTRLEVSIVGASPDFLELSVVSWILCREKGRRGDRWVGEKKTVLPDVKKKEIVYTFRGEESFQKRKRRQEQARFMKLFEDTDDIEDELGIGPLSESI